jgi:DNA-binding FrmR family transcriptional regulator
MAKRLKNDCMGLQSDWKAIPKQSQSDEKAMRKRLQAIAGDCKAIKKGPKSDCRAIAKQFQSNQFQGNQALSKRLQSNCEAIARLSARLWSSCEVATKRGFLTLLRSLRTGI